MVLASSERVRDMSENSQSTPGQTPADAERASESTAGHRRKRVLFLEENTSCLQLTQDQLRGRDCGWEIVYSASGAESLRRLATERFDAVVSGLHMPATNGLEFLNEVGRRYPHALRFIRCSPEDRSVLRHCVGPVPHYISNEVDGETLADTINRAFRLEEWMSKPETGRLIGQCRKLPALPEVYHELTAELQKLDPAFDRVADLIAKDPAMTAKILHLVNSAFFAFPRQITEAREAVILLGLERTRALILLVHVFSEFEKSRCRGFSADRLRQHALGTGVVAKKIVETETRDFQLAESAFTAGLLHDIGQLLLAANLPVEYAHVLDVARERQVPIHQAEGDLFGTTHAELGACLLALWGLPLPILEAIAWHHAPGRSDEPHFSTLTAVHAADAFLEGADAVDGQAAPALDEAYLAALGLTHRVALWRQLAGTAS